MKKYALFIIILSINLIPNIVFSQRGLVVNKDQHAISINSFYGVGLNESEGIIRGLGANAVISGVFEVGLDFGTELDKDKNKEGNFTSLYGSYYFLKESEKGVSLLLNVQRQNSSFGSRSLKVWDFGLGIFKTLSKRESNFSAQIGFTPRFLQSSQSEYNNKFAIGSILTLNIFIKKSVLTISPYFLRVFGLCCKRGSSLGIGLTYGILIDKKA